jgi:hypothetical protein
MWQNLFERDGEDQSSSRSAAFAGDIVRSDLPETFSAHLALRPLWADEAMERGYSTVCLVNALERKAPVMGESPTIVDREIELASDLARVLRSLTYSNPSCEMTCSRLIGDVVQDLFELFGSVAGNIAVDKHIDHHLVLPALRARALTLLICHLIVQALFCGLGSFERSHISVNLYRTTRARARLIVTSYGSGLDHLWAESCCSQADLALLLESKLSYCSDVARSITASAESDISS